MISTIGQLRDFKESFIWKDITEELDIWLHQIHEQLENHGMASSHRQLDRLGGCAEAIRNFNDILEVLTAVAEDDLVARKFKLDKMAGR